MIGAPNTRGQKNWVGIVQWAAETSVSEEIADILTNYNIDDCYRTRAAIFDLFQSLIGRVAAVLCPFY